MSRIEKLSSKEYRSNLRDFYFLEVASPFARREASRERFSNSNLEAVRKAKHSLSESGCVTDKWVELDPEFDIMNLIRPLIEKGDYIVVRLRYVSAESEEAICDGDYVLVNSCMYECTHSSCMYECTHHAMTAVYLSAFEPITHFEKSFYIMEHKEILLSKLQTVKEEENKLQCEIEKLDAILLSKLQTVKEEENKLQCEIEKLDAQLMGR